MVKMTGENQWKIEHIALKLPLKRYLVIAKESIILQWKARQMPPQPIGQCEITSNGGVGVGNQCQCCIPPVMKHSNTSIKNEDHIQS